MNRPALIAALCLASPAAAQLDWEGEAAGVGLSASLITHARQYSLVLVSPEAGGLPAQDRGLAILRLRPQLELGLGERLGAEVAWDLLPLFGDGGQGLDLAVTPSNHLRVADLDPTLHTGDDYTVRHGLDRAVLRYAHPYFEVRLGRQAIGHGSARIFPAADPFSQKSPASIDNEFKPGVDAARLTVPLGEAQEVEAFAVIDGDAPGDGVYLGRWRASLPGLDLSVLAGSAAAAPMAALDLSGDLGGAGWYAEASARLEADPTVRATAGLDYQFPWRLRVVLEGHYNGVGELDPADYLAVTTTRAFRDGETTLLGPAYLGVGGFYEARPTMNLGLSWLQNLTDGSALASPSIAWDFAEDVALALGALLPMGARPSLEGLHSEFGTYPYIVFTDLRLAL